jgi:hypothetical protein
MFFTEAGRLYEKIYVEEESLPQRDTILGGDARTPDMFTLL